MWSFSLTTLPIFKVDDNFAVADLCVTSTSFPPPPPACPPFSEPKPSTPAVGGGGMI